MGLTFDSWKGPTKAIDRGDLILDDPIPGLYPMLFWLPSNCLLEGSLSDAFCISGLQTLAWSQCSQDSPRCDTQDFPWLKLAFWNHLQKECFNLSKRFDDRPGFLRLGI